MTPQETIEHLTEFARQIEEAKSKAVFVGLPKEKSSRAYQSGLSVIDVGAIHEFGSVNNPKRSFLRAPFALKESELEKVISAEFKLVSEDGKSVNDALNIVGVAAQSISQEAFTTKGYGTWTDIKQSTKNAKGSSQVLVDTGALRQSITFVVRG